MDKRYNLILCNKTHEYVLFDNDCFHIGVTDVLLRKLGNISHIDLPAVNEQFTKGEIFGFIESEHFAKELYIPHVAQIIEVNNALLDNPSLLTPDNFLEMWLIKTTGQFFDIDKIDLIPYSEYIQNATP